MIEGIVVKAMKVVPDERGHLLEILRNDEPLFSKFGQVYVTTTYPGVVKGWHCHRKQTDFICCVSGMIKLVLYLPKDLLDVGQNRAGQVDQLFIGEHNPCLVKIPPGVWHGWKCISANEAVIVCVTDEPYNYADPDELRADPHGNEILYSWGRRDG